jgi:hypothetical protein
MMKEAEALHLFSLARKRGEVNRKHPALDRVPDAAQRRVDR